MEHWLPLFPLNIVPFPGEKLNLHIFEPRYKELISDCLKSNNFFGIPSYVKTKIEFGASVKIAKVEKIYDDGRMDIMTQAERVFRVVHLDNPSPEKLYAKGKVEFLENVPDSSLLMQKEIISKVKELFNLMNVSGSKLKPEHSMFDIAHQIGMSPDQEYELLKITKESDRQRFVLAHLDKLLPTLKEVERTKQRIRMNGHFRNFNPIDF